MLQDVFLDGGEAALKEEVRNFVKAEVSSDLVKKMDRDEITYPREFVKALGNRNLLGLRFPVAYGGRGLSWAAEIATLEEIGVLGTALGCAFSMPRLGRLDALGILRHLMIRGIERRKIFRDGKDRDNFSSVAEICSRKRRPRAMPWRFCFALGRCGSWESR
jgi:hypothetical protein